MRKALGLSPHPEGGHYRELWRDRPASGLRGAGTSILFLLAAGERSHWHRVDAAEIWLWQAGAPLLLGIAGVDGGRQDIRLGPDLASGEALQGVVPARAWQEASSLGAQDVVRAMQPYEAARLERGHGFGGEDQAAEALLHRSANDTADRAKVGDLFSGNSRDCLRNRPQRC